MYAAVPAKPVILPIPETTKISARRMRPNSATRSAFVGFMGRCPEERRSADVLFDLHPVNLFRLEIALGITQVRAGAQEEIEQLRVDVIVDLEFVQDLHR